jgi:hypothetical protein
LLITLKAHVAPWAHSFVEQLVEGSAEEASARSNTMHHFCQSCVRAALVVGLAASSAAAVATQTGKTPLGVDYASGGVSQEELRALHERRDAYSLWVITAASKSGAHLADVLVTVRDSTQRVVFNRRLDGPWLFIDLPLGRYQVEAALNGQAQQRMTTIHKGDHHQLFFYFDTSDAVSGEQRTPLDRNPYGAPTK